MRSDALDAAFRATTYRVESGEGVFELRIGIPNAAFDDFLRRRGVSRWGMITAYNPGGVRSYDENLLRHHRLLEQLQARGWSCLSTCNLADDGVWPEEPGFLILQVSETEACTLAAEFLQSACVCGDIGSTPRLVWL